MRVQTNSFKITRIAENKAYHQYDAFEPEIRQTSRRIEFFERLQNHIEPAMFTPKVIYDGNAIAYSSRDLAIGQSHSFPVSMSDRPDGKAHCVITFRRVSADLVEFSELRKFISGQTQQQTPKVIMAINLLQLIVRQASNLQHPNNVKAFFSKRAGFRSLGGGLEVWKGFYQSVRPARDQILINVDITSGVMYQEGRFIDVALSVLGQSDVRALRLEESAPGFRQLKSFFKGVFIGLAHLPARRKKRIQSIVTYAGHFNFQKDSNDGSAEISVQQYYRETYNIHIKYPDIIGVVLSGSSKDRTVVIPAELCMVLPNQRYIRKLPQEYAKGMVEFTSERPRERMAAILNGMGSGNANPVLSYANSPFIQEAGLAISNTPSLIDGQLLPAPEMVYAPGGGVVSPRDGGWNVVNQRFHRPQSVSTWAVVDYSLNRGRARTNTETFITMLVDCCKKLGMGVGMPNVVRSGTLNVHEDLHRAGKEASSRVPPDLILVVLPASAAEIRLAVKQFGDVLHGISTQCVREDKIARCNNQYCNNVAMKINAKLGGINAVPRDDSLTLLKKRPFMIMGADVGHPAPGVRDQPSVASLVFSFEPLGMCYEAICSIQPPRLEVIEELGNMVKRAVTMFGRKNQISPHSIIFFRDGLSEGEYDRAAASEIQSIKAAINTLWEELRMKDPQPLLTYIVVGKKHHVRFFPTSPQDSDKSGNCKAGFVAAEGIGNPMAKDFYLQSHGGLLGTSRPSHYIVLKDETFNGNLKVLQRLSYSLCHAYARATRSVSIPAPVYYADIVCGRANYHFNPKLHYDDSAASSVSGNTSFDLTRWQSGYKPRHDRMLGKMYFM